MAGYYPPCPNCHTCQKCRGEGTIIKVTYEIGEGRKQYRKEERKTCPSCNGVGGRVGVGKHDHR